MHTKEYSESFSPLEFSDQQKRKLLVITVSIFPLVLTSIVFGLVVWIGGITFPEKLYPKSAYGEIVLPLNKSTLTIGKPFAISGTVNSVSEKEFLYLVEHREKHYWPKKALGNVESSWKMQLTPRGKRGKPVNYLLVKVDEAGKGVFETWFKTARETGQYPGMTDIEFAQPVAKTRVKTK